ncbi:MAG TPA: CBS domain-containing protein [Gemmataceae bacterium]|nr:CBS domain-containing protein [Gemmataceae bacterium]
MICPTCAYDNLPGSEECRRCHTPLTQLDLPTPHDRVERTLMEDPVRVLQPRPAVTVPPTASVRQAVEVMLARDIGAVLVVDDDGRLLGIFSERDLLTKVVGEPGAGPNLPVSQFMTPDPETVTADDTLAFALRAMDLGGYRHLPVVHNGLPVGVISVRDMLRHITRLCKDR